LRVKGQRMIETTTIMVEGPEGTLGHVRRDEITAPGEGAVLVSLDTGERLYVPRHFFQMRPDGSLYLPLRKEQWDQFRAASTREQETIVPVAREELRVRTQRVETGKVVVNKTVREREEVVDQPIMQEQVDVQRITMNRFIDAPVEPRQEGDAWVIPLMEEVLVVEKRLLLKEELRIVRRRTLVRHSQRVVLRTEEADVKHVDLMAPKPA